MSFCLLYDFVRILKHFVVHKLESVFAAVLANPEVCHNLDKLQIYYQRKRCKRDNYIETVGHNFGRMVDLCNFGNHIYNTGRIAASLT